MPLKSATVPAAVSSGRNQAAVSGNKPLAKTKSTREGVGHGRVRRPAV